MTTLCKTLPDKGSALCAASALMTAGADICVLMGSREDVAERGGPHTAEVDRQGILTLTYHHGHKCEGATDDNGARRLLTDAYLPESAAQRMVRHVREGESVICVQLVDIDLATVDALIARRTQDA